MGNYSQNNYSRSNGQRNGNDYNGRGYAKTYERSSNKPHSGCSMKTDYITKQGVLKEVVINGWKYTKRNGLVSFVAVPASSKYQKNEKYICMVAKIKSTFGEKLEWCYWNKGKKILNFIGMKMVASPDKGYWSFLAPKK